MSLAARRFTRRNFLKTAKRIGIGAVLGGFKTTAASAGSVSTERPAKVPTRPFGKSGIEVSMLALGGMFDIVSNQLLLKQALRWGVTYWDTADCYGRGKSEKGIGKYFQKYPADRRKVFLVTKSDDRDPDGLSRLLDRSLQRMQTSYVDLYFVHGISGIDELNERTRRWAERAKAEGKIRLFGFSTHSNMEACLLGAARLGWIDGIMMSYNFRLMHSEGMKKAVAQCVRAGIGLTAMKTQGGGAVKTSTETELELAGRFLEKGFSDKQARLKAVWQNPHIASICSQMPSMTILMANTAAALDRNTLSAGDVDLLKRYASETASDYCAGCSRLCETALAEDFPIGDVMRYLMYSRSYQDHARAVSAFRRIPLALRNKMALADYSAAEKKCPQHMAIGRLMKAATVTLA